MGDAFNWEWMVQCAKNRNAELVIVSRDSDYGGTFDDKAYINDHLRQEFSDRVSKKRTLLLYSRLSEALKHFSVKVTPAEEQAETELTRTSKAHSVEPENADFFKSLIEKIFRDRFNEDLTIRKKDASQAEPEERQDGEPAGQKF